MSELNQFYKCEICGNLVSVIEAGKGELVCCGQPMKLQKPNQGPEEYGKKHIPVIEGLKIKVGAVEHPMEEKHYIELIQAFIDGKLVVEKRLYPGQKPELELMEKYRGKKITARMYCNIHGLWKN